MVEMTGLLQIKSSGWVDEFKYHFCIIDDSVIYYKSISRDQQICVGYHKVEWNKETHLIK